MDDKIHFPSIVVLDLRILQIVIQSDLTKILKFFLILCCNFQ
jgi:hypothetical protein